ncbi:MAG: phosphoglycolate phosphatase [Blastocatellia bacterium]|nr:phosphoglycolate phosphatase [Blastocatellia bacterium]
MSSIRLFLFDLDGTLIDSRHDIMTGLNSMLVELDLEPFPIADVTRFIGDGARKLVERGLRARLAEPPTESEIDQGLEIFKKHYGRHLLDTTVPYPNVVRTLEHFSHLQLGVVTNKPYGFSKTILDGLNLTRFFSAIIGGDSAPERKPHPAPVLAALSHCEVAASEAVMVGDSSHDVRAGKAAGTLTCGVTYGLRSRQELVEIGADLIVDDMAELIDLFKTGLRTED